MNLGLFSVTLFSCVLSTFATMAQDATTNTDTPSVEADLASLKVRAAERRQGMDYLTQIASQVQQQNVPLAEVVSNMLGMAYDPMNSDLRYRVIDQIKVALGRAERYAAILSNDLDGDGSVTRSEIADSLKFGQARRGSAAETLITYDADQNNILSPDEIVVAVAEADAEARSRRMNYVPAELLDFDDDGTLSAEEMERATAALKLTEALQ
jgi:hypothetical protein